MKLSLLNISVYLLVHFALRRSFSLFCQTRLFDPARPPPGSWILDFPACPSSGLFAGLLDLPALPFLPA